MKELMTKNLSKKMRLFNNFRTRIYLKIKLLGKLKKLVCRLILS